jgi:hypothetical protein
MVIHRTSLYRLSDSLSVKNHAGGMRIVDPSSVIVTSSLLIAAPMATATTSE